MTWEYCKDIKKDYVDTVEEFWQRQRPPTSGEVKSISERPHPHVGDFKNISVLLSFGVSKVRLPVSDIGEHLSVEVEAASSSSKNGDDDNEIPALHLRGYQLEGVNWLLWNWCNCRS